MAFSVLIVDDSSVIRRLLRTFLEKNGEWHVCGEAENGKIAVEKVELLRPDVVILDLQMPVLNGLDAARQIAVVAPNTSVLMFTMHTSQQVLRDALAAGIKHVVSKAEHVEGLLTALKSVCPPS